MDPISVLATPKYAQIKNTFEVLDERVRVLKARISTNPHHVNYLTLMKEIRKRVLDLIKSHKLYNELDYIQRKSDPINGEIPLETIEALSALCKPRQKDLQFALKKINQLIRLIKNDFYFEQNPHKIKRCAELFEQRKKICCMMQKYKPIATQSRECYRFAPCEEKIINVFEIPREDKPNSRFLKIVYDKHTKEIGYPQLRRLQNTLQFYIQMRNNNLEKLKENPHMSEQEMTKIYVNIKYLNERIEFIQNFKNELIALMPAQNQPDDCGDMEIRPENFKGYTRHIEHPKRIRLEQSLLFYQQYLKKLQKRNKINDEILNSFNKVKPLSTRIEQNILFIKNYLQEIPQQKQHCGNAEEEKVDQKRSPNMTKIKELSEPKRTALQATLETYIRLLQDFENDYKNASLLRSLNSSNEEEDDNEETESRKKWHYENLQKHLNQVKSLLAEKNNPLQDGSESIEKVNYHGACLINVPPRFVYSKYKMLKAYKQITSSEPSAKYLQSSLSAYEKWIQDRKTDIKYRDEIELLLNNLKMESTEEDGLEDEKDNRKKLTHTERMLKNKTTVENQLSNVNSVEDSHFQAHKKFEKDLKTNKKSLPPRSNNLDKLAMPKKIILNHTFLRYSHFMSESKVKRLENELRKDFWKPEVIEGIFRKESSPKRKQKFSSKVYDKSLRNKLLFKILQETKLFDEFIRFSILSAINNYHVIE